MKDRLTIVTSTHKFPSDRLDIKGVRKSSQTELLEHVYTDLLKYVDTNVKWIICLDFAKQTDECKQYRDNIQSLVDRLPSAELVCTSGWRENMTMGKNMVKTPYFLFWEHDWVFNVPVNITDILNVMDGNGHINYIRFNKRQHNRGLDMITGGTESYGNVKLTPTTNWSNNPHICRTSFWNEKAYPDLINRRLPGGEWGDEYINKHSSTEHNLKTLCRADGQKSWGSYLYGPLNTPPAVKHLDGNNWKNN